MLFSDIGLVTSPFYPILIPNQKTPSPLSEDKSQISRNLTGYHDFRGISQDRDTTSYTEMKTSIQAFDISQFKTTEDTISIKVSSENDSFKSSIRNLYSYELEDNSRRITNEDIAEKDTGRMSGNYKFNFTSH